jgi:diaminohydroxyphosphoribosylaminopyrimidine deaminase/5-amino-6-(5-phosphoribosylamino)uracil reductase
MYVTLEPCCHHGRTRPCTDAIIEAGLSSVYVGVIDPNPLVHGQGLACLQEAGIYVERDVLAVTCSELHAPFYRYIRDGRPWVIIKGATTIDGQIATRGGHSKWITGEEARVDAHRLRARADAVLVGSETARLDDPRLNVRLIEGPDPIPVVLDTRAQLDPNSLLLGHGALVFVGREAPGDRVDGLRATGAELIRVDSDEDGLDLSAVLKCLAERGIVNLLVEGGGRLHGSLLRARLADEACFYIAPKLLGQGRPLLPLEAPNTIDQAYTLTGIEITPLANDVRVRGKIKYPV